jgi:hypothetical protein
VVGSKPFIVSGTGVASGGVSQLKSGVLIVAGWLAKIAVET